MLSPSIDAFENGKSRIVSTVAFAMNPVYVSLVPAASYSAFLFFRSDSQRLKSTSYAENTCGDVWMLITMCSAIFFRITPIFSMRTFSPGLRRCRRSRRLEWRRCEGLARDSPSACVDAGAPDLRSGLAQRPATR